MTNVDLTNNPYFNQSNLEMPCFEIYKLLPRCSADSEGNVIKTDPALLIALKQHLANANDTMLNGLYSLGNLLGGVPCDEKYSINSADLQNLGWFIALNINLLQANIELAGNIDNELKA